MSKKPQGLYTLCILTQRECILSKYSRAETKNLYIAFIAGSSVVATVFACTSILPML